MLVELRREISLLRALDSPYVVKVTSPRPSHVTPAIPCHPGPLPTAITPQIIESYENERFLFLVEEVATH